MEESLAESIEKLEIWVTGHFLLYSGLHTQRYFNKDMLYVHPSVISRICRKIAGEFQRSRVEVVVAPATGGCILSNRVAESLADFPPSFTEASAVYADKTADGGFVIRRGYEKFVTDKRVLIVEDVGTTGASVRKVIELVQPIAKEIVGLSFVCNRGGLTTDDFPGVQKFFSVFGSDDAESIALTKEECLKSGPCSLGIPISTELGHGSKK